MYNNTIAVDVPLDLPVVIESVVPIYHEKNPTQVVGIQLRLSPGSIKIPSVYAGDILLTAEVQAHLNSLVRSAWVRSCIKQISV